MTKLSTGWITLLACNTRTIKTNLIYFLGISRYYTSQQLTDKSDVYSFGVILLELISGREAVSNWSFGANCRTIVQWVSQLASVLLFWVKIQSPRFLLPHTWHTCKISKPFISWGMSWTNPPKSELFFITDLIETTLIRQPKVERSGQL